MISNIRGQMKLSFGMIFSIFLIILFISFAFVAIKKFLALGNLAQISGFAENLQDDIDKAWKGTQSSQVKTYNLPSKIEYICFADYSGYPGGYKGDYKELYSELKQIHQEYENFFFYPIGSSEGLESKEIKHINIETITSNNNPLCFRNVEGKITLTIEKEYGEALVVIKK
ncbi:MAG: hypothetical protein OQK82_05460 [Candidatus Pacearchaeota archaeon]|nr:hypothetical protein [Candidatus Pacearchaeota archaeon]